MSDSIERQAAIDALTELARERFTIQDYFQIYLDALTDADIKIRQLPSAQLEIIRCKDCIKREICRTTNIWAVAPGDDWYCADADRKTDE